jgi:hypothetical protein
MSQCRRLNHVSRGDWRDGPNQVCYELGIDVIAGGVETYEEYG